MVVHLGPLRKFNAKSAVVMLIAFSLLSLLYSLQSLRLNMLNEVRNAVVIFNKVGTDMVEKQPGAATSDNGTRRWTSMNNASTTPAGFSELTTVKRKLISVELVGAARLGNLMFGHASMLGMADNTSLEPIVSERNRLLLHAFDLGTAHKAIETAYWHTCHEKFASVYDDSLVGQILNSERDALLFGYFQSWRYFNHIRLRIIKEFQFKSQFREVASKFIQSATLKHYPDYVRNQTLRSRIVRIGIHVRRGDMLAPSSIQKGFTTADAGYLARAMAYLEKRLRNTHPYLMYIVVSDDIPWCQSNIVSATYPIEFSTGNDSPYVDLAILSSCNHTVTTVGTFSWWAGYLAGGITVYYKNFPANGSETAKVFRAEDYFPPTWIGML